MKLFLNDSKDTFKSSENFDSSSFTKKVSKKSLFHSENNENENNNNDTKNNTDNNLPNKNQYQNSLNKIYNKSISIKFENILEDQKSVAKLMKNIFTRVLYINNPGQSYNLFLEKLSSTDSKFYDNQFPPNLNSLIKGYKSPFNDVKNNNNIKQSPLDKYKNIIWKRESELNFFPETDVFPKNGIFSNLKSISPGHYTSNNFLSAIIAMSKYPKIIRKLFLTDKKNKNGIYGLKIAKNGFLQEIVLDDYFPVLKSLQDIINNSPNNNSYHLCFTHSKDNTLWVQILEKAFAKAYGSYEILSKKNIESILKDISCAPIILLDSLNSELALNLTLANENNWIVMVSAGDTEASYDLLKELDLKPDFNYEILDVFKLGIEDLAKLNYIQMNNVENVQIILKIRNIWGKINWEGEWSKTYKFWDDDLKKKLKYDPKDDQSFYMNLRDFKNYFYKIKICKVFEDYYYKSIKIKQKPNKYVLIKLDTRKPNIIDDSSKYFVSLIQEEKENNNFLVGRMILCKVKDKELKEVEYIQGIMGQGREIFIEQKESFIGGEFLLYCELDSNDDKPINYVVSAYLFEDFDIQEINYKSYPNIIEKIYISCAKKKKLSLNFDSNEDSINDEENNKSNDNINNNIYRSNSFKKIKIKNAPKIIKYTETTPEGFSYIYIENLEEDVTLIENANYQHFEGYKLLYPNPGTSFYIEVKPGECKIIIIKRLELIESNNIEVFYRTYLLYGNESLYKLTKKKGRKKKRIDKKTGKKTNINVYILKHDFGICFLYRNKTSRQILKEKVNIENNSNIDFSDENKPDANKKEIKICVEPHKDYFLKLKSKNFSWKVNPVFSYSIETAKNITNEEDEKSESNSPKNFFVNKKKLNRTIKTFTDSVVSNMNYKNDLDMNLYKNNKIDENDNENDNENDIENDNENDNENENEESIENEGDSSDINISDDNSDGTI